MLYEKEILKALHKAINTENYYEETSVYEVPDILFVSTYYTNRNRRVSLKVDSYSVEVYSKFDDECLKVVEERTLLAVKFYLGCAYHRLKHLLEK